MVEPCAPSACSAPALATSSVEVQAAPGLRMLPTTRPMARATVDIVEEVAERQAADLADPGRAAHRADAEHDRAEDDRLDHHLDQRTNASPSGLSSTAKSGRDEPDDDAERRPRR